MPIGNLIGEANQSEYLINEFKELEQWSLQGSQTNTFANSSVALFTAEDAINSVGNLLVVVMPFAILYCVISLLNSCTNQKRN